MKYFGYVCFYDCFSSFVGWKGFEVIYMVVFGFFYMGFNDLVVCYYCGVKFKSWKFFYLLYFEYE